MSSTEFQINTYTIGSQSHPSVSNLSDGGFVVTWNSYGQSPGDSVSQAGIYGQRYDSSGVADGDEFQINTTNYGSQIVPAVANLSDGGFVVI